MQVESRREGGKRADEAAIRPDHDVPDLQTSRLSRTSWSDVIDHHTPILREPQSLGQIVGDRLSSRFDFDPMHVPILAQALVHEVHDSGPNGKSQPFAAPAGALDGS